MSDRPSIEDRIAAKRRGGDANLLGHLFEEVVVVHNLLDAAVTWFLNGQEGDGGTIERQLWGPVDDIGFTTPSGFRRFIQAKHGLRVHWDSSGLEKEYGLFEEYFKGADDAYMQIAVASDCETLTPLLRSVQSAGRCQVEKYLFIDLPSEYWASHEMKRYLTAICVDNRHETLLAACYAVSSAAGALLANRVRRRATVNAVLAQAQTLASTCFSLRPTEASSWDVDLIPFNECLALALRLEGSILTIADQSGDEEPFFVASPTALISLLDWLSHSKPTEVMEVREFWGGEG